MNLQELNWDVQEMNKTCCVIVNCVVALKVKQLNVATLSWCDSKLHIECFLSQKHKCFITTEHWRGKTGVGRGFFLMCNSGMISIQTCLHPVTSQFTA